MIKDIQYKGYAANPSDYECEDGELAMSLNLIHEDGSLKPILPPKILGKLTANERIIYTHECSIHTNYIIINDLTQKISWWNTDINKNTIIDVNGYRDNVLSVGNTLIFTTDNGLHYFLWKNEGYLNLGNELPELNVNPYITTRITSALDVKKKFGVIFSTDSDDLGVKIDFKKKDTIISNNNPANVAELDSEDRASISERIFPVINVCRKSLREKGYFLEPFYVRFAYRMYDGSHTMHTVPVLMTPTSWGKPIMALGCSDGDIYFNPVFSMSTLHYDINTDIGDWKDIITHIDIFVTEPLIDYSDSAESLSRVLKYNPFDNNINSCEHGKPLMMDNTSWKTVDDVINSTNKDGLQSSDVCKMKIPRVGTWLGGYKWRKLFDIQRMSDDDFIVIKPHSKYTIYCKDAWENDVSIRSINAINEKFPGWKVYSVRDMRPSENVYFYLETDSNAKKEEYVDYSIVTLETTSINCQYYIETRRTDGLEYNEVLSEYSSFYKINEIDLRQEGNDMDMSFDKMYVLQDLTVRPSLLDIGSNRNKALSNYMLNYNSRLNLVVDGVKITDAGTSLKTQNPARYLSYLSNVLRAYVEIYDNSQYAYVEIPVSEDNDFCTMEGLLYFSYPHNNVKNLVLLIETPTDFIIRDEYTYFKLTIPLKCHSFLNMSYAFNGFETLKGESEQLKSIDDFIIPSNDTIKYGNIIRLSDVNNPFRFSEEFTVSLPVKEIYALSTAAKALSQGQFGQYPLYAFTSEGIWALEITSTGTYSARQPISRDVVINKESITQIDSAVLFATDRGIMLISGSQVICISDKINSMDQFALEELPKADNLMDIYRNIVEDINNTVEVPEIPSALPEQTLPPNPSNPPSIKSVPAGNKNDIPLDDVTLLPFNEFLINCRMIYDYVNQHIIVYNPEVRYAYVYSLKSQLWGMMYSRITHNVNSYPKAFAMENNTLVDFSKIGNNKTATIIVTRPLDMGAPNAFKTISTIIQRGNRGAATNQVLYGSNDLVNWFVVWSSDNRRMSGFSGSPWKYYRIVVIRKFDKSESLHGFTVQYEHRLTNRLR